MLAKLISVLSTTKGAAAALVVATAAATGGVAATNSDVQQAVQNTVAQVTNTKPAECVQHEGQPAVVKARNDADKNLRGHFQDDQQTLEKLHSTKVGQADRETLNDTIKTADDALRARLTKALDDVAALTLGREGHETENPSSATTTAAPCDRGANVTFDSTAQGKVDGIVKDAIFDMNEIVKHASDKIGNLPTVTPGKPGDAGKPENKPTTPEHPTPAH